MTKKDYEKFAAMLKKHVDHVDSFSDPDRGLINVTLQYVAEDMANIFSADNAAFNRQRFMAACGVDS